MKRAMHLLRMPSTAELRRHCDSRLERMDQKRRPWLDYCRKVAEELLPNRLTYLTNTTTNEKAGEQNRHIVDAVGHLALATAGAGVTTGTMPSTSAWFEYGVRGVADDDTDSDAQLFLEESAQRILTMHNGGNANNVVPRCQEEWIAFGTGAALIVEDEEQLYRLIGLTVGEYWIADDYRGRCDTIYRKVTMTIGQLAAEFGVDALSDSTADKYYRGEVDEEIECVHAIEPDNDGINPEGDNPDLPWRSVYYETAGPADRVLAIRGYHRFPGLVWRAQKVSGSPYGYGRGHDALPHLRRLRGLIYELGEALSYKIRPPVQVPATMAAHEVRSLPGMRTKVTGDIPISTLWKVDQELREIGELIESTKQDIRDTLGATLVSSLRRITQQMTKREAELRTSQDLTEWLPGLVTMQDELLAPLVEWYWQIAYSRGLLGLPPESLNEQQIDTKFVSPLARRQRENEVDAIVETYAITGEIAKVRPDVVDNLDVDGAVRLIAQIKGASTKAFVPIEQVKKLRAERAELQNAQAQAAAAQQGADVAATVAKARVA